MALVLNEEQALLKESAKDFFNLRAPISAIRKLRDEKHPDGFEKALWAEMAKLGFAGITIPEKYEGLEFGYVALGQLLEENGRTLSASPIISTVLMSATLLNLAGTEEQKNEYLPQIASGNLLVSLAHQETSVYKPNRVETKATKEGNNYILNGSKTFVLDAHVADKLVVSTQLNSEVALFIVDAKIEGLKITKTPLIDSRYAANLELTNVKVLASDKLSGGKETLESTLDITCIGLSAEMLGLAQEGFERTVAYLKERKQFGVTIGSFQALQHRAAKIFIEIELCKSIVIKALTAVDNNSENLSQLASLAKAKLGQTVKLVTNEAIQMHGGIGMTDDMDFGFFIKRARVLQQTLGDYNYHLDRYASLNGY
ncbi:MAG: alkylation response protein AidB-like acyl-CoA dehydrogenase [Arcticibacterium sp.]|jgi:alkylation response protein AidB-like acyl-CoA dehydrogenase